MQEIMKQYASHVLFRHYADYADWNCSINSADQLKTLVAGELLANNDNKGDVDAIIRLMLERVDFTQIYEEMLKFFVLDRGIKKELETTEQTTAEG